MRKLPVALGSLLILACIAILLSYNSSVTNPEWKTESEINGDWEISGNFDQGDNITLIVAWSAITYGEDLGELPTNVTITAPNGDTTTFTVFFLGNPNSPPGQEAGRQQIYVSRIALLSNDGDSLTVDDPPRQIGGIVKTAGTFKARVLPPPDSFPWAGYPESEPPTALRLLKIAINITYPYRVFFPAGVISGILGGVVIVVWRNGSNRRVERAKLRARKSR